MNLPVPVEPAAYEIVPYERSQACANWGRWVSECTGEYCRNAWMVRPGDRSWTCNSCGLENEIEWPADPGAIECMLMMRRDPATRNWKPGEPIEQLLIENVQHDMAPSWLLESAERIPDVMTVVDGRVVSGALLPLVERRRELLAAGRTFEVLPERVLDGEIVAYAAPAIEGA